MYLKKKWSGNELNMCILPGYCVVGTVGNKLLTGKQGPQKVEIDKKTTLDVKCSVKSLSFSAHADAKGIMQLIRQTEPKNVLLVHGEKGKMNFLKQKIKQEFGINCYDPPNGVCVPINTPHSVSVDVSNLLLKRHIEDDINNENDDLELSTTPTKKIKAPMENIPVHGVLVINEETKTVCLLDPSEAIDELVLNEHQLTFSSEKELPQQFRDKYTREEILDTIYSSLKEWVNGVTVSKDALTIKIRSIQLRIDEIKSKLLIEWSFVDEILANHLLSLIDSVLNVTSMEV